MSSGKGIDLDEIKEMLEVRDEVYDEYTSSALHDLAHVLDGVIEYLKSDPAETIWRSVTFDEGCIVLSVETNFSEPSIFIKDPNNGMVLELDPRGTPDLDSLLRVLTIKIPEEIVATGRTQDTVVFMHGVEDKGDGQHMLYAPQYNADQEVRYIPMGYFNLSDLDPLMIQDDVDGNAVTEDNSDTTSIDEMLSLDLGKKRVLH